MTNFEGDNVEDRRKNIFAIEISHDNDILKTALSLSRTLISIYILPSESRMHMTQEVCTSNVIQNLTRIFPML